MKKSFSQSSSCNEVSKILFSVKFRGVITTPDLRPFDGKASYKLQDPSGNIIIRQSDANLTQGVVGSQFKLGRYSTQGTWTISYEVHVSPFLSANLQIQIRQ